MQIPSTFVHLVTAFVAAGIQRPSDRSSIHAQGHLLQGLNSSAAIALGSVLHLDANTDLADASVTVNGNEQCTVNITELPSGGTGAAIESSSTPQRMGSSYGQLLGVDGKFLRLIGVNYFGFDVSYPMLDGLWVSGLLLFCVGL